MFIVSKLENKRVLVCEWFFFNSHGVKTKNAILKSFLSTKYYLFEKKNL